jgi:hypothetical protein
MIEQTKQCPYCETIYYNQPYKECPKCNVGLVKIVSESKIAVKFKSHDSGATRSTDKDNVAYHLISPIALKVLAQVLKEGGQKYGEYNWENGFPVTDILNHAVGHIYDFLSGDRSEDHLGHAFTNLMFAIHSMKLWPELNTDLRREGCLPAEKFVKIKQAQK